MKKALFVDCCIRREESRTKRLADSFLARLSPDYAVQRLTLMEEGLQPLMGDFFAARQALLAAGKLEHPRFRYARQFADADLVVIAAPFWDLSFPALLKIYIENITVEGITFGCNENGCYGICKGQNLVFLTARGGVYTGTTLEQGSRQWEALSRFFGFKGYHCIAAEGLDIAPEKAEEILAEAEEKAAALAEKL